jgi:heavy metal sensor kinase
MSRRPFDRTLQALVVALAVALLAGGAVAGWGAARLARRLTRPLEAIADAAGTVGEHSLSARIPEVSEDREVRGVVAILNAMLARLEAAFAKERQLVMAQRRFVADASHELRSPLSNLRGNVEVALRRPRAADEYRETLAAALGEIERMTRLTNALLTLSRIDAGQLDLMLTPCELSAIAADAVNGLAARAGQRGICVRLEAHDALEVEGDADRLRAVLDNLLDNALRYAPEGSEIVVTARRENGTAAVTVRDEGPGLSREDQAHVFERFFRADRSRARNSGGAGLGLAIAMALVEAHQGRLTVQSAPGSGAAFSLRLPIRRRA